MSDTDIQSQVVTVNESPSALPDATDATKAIQVIERSPTPLDLIQRAVQSNSQVEVMEKLLGLQERWERNEARKAFDSAISKAKSEIPIIRKGNLVDFTSTKGRTHYSYEDLATIAATVDPILSKYGLSYRFRTNSDCKSVTITCVLSHSAGHCEENSLYAPHDASGNKNPIQAVGSAVTYLQRYTLKAALGLAASADDDARGANPNPLDPPAKPQATQASQAPKPAPTPPKAIKTPPTATVEGKTRLLALLAPIEHATEFFRKAGGLLPNEELDDLPLSHVPATKEQADALFRTINAFAAGEEARMPYPLNAEPAPAKTPKAEKPATVQDRLPLPADAPDAPWRSFVMPFGKDKGKTLADLDKRTLFGWVKNFKVELEYQGKPKSPGSIAADQALRDCLDQANAHYRFDEKKD